MRNQLLYVGGLLVIGLSFKFHRNRLSGFRDVRFEICLRFLIYAVVG